MPAAFGVDDEVVAESFGANDEVIAAFGQDDEAVGYPSKDAQRSLTVQTSTPRLPSDPYAGAAEEMVRPAIEQRAPRPLTSDEQTERALAEVALLGPSPVEPLTRGPLLPQLAGNLARAFFEQGAVPFSKLNVTPQQVNSALSEIASASPDLSSEDAQAMREATTLPDGLAKSIAGTQQAMNGALEAMTTPFALITLGTGAVFKGVAARVLSGLFAADMASHTPGQVMEFRHALSTGDPEAIARTGTGMGLSGVFMYGAGRHALEPRSPMKTAGERLLAATEDPGNIQALKTAAQDFALQATDPRNAQRTLIPKTDQAVESVTEAKGPVVVTPAPTPTAVVSESGFQSAPVTAGELPPPRATLPLEEAQGRPTQLLSTEGARKQAEPGATAVQKVVDYFKPPPDEAVPAMVVDTGTPLPDLQPKDVANAVFSKPFGVEKIPVLGRMAGGRARIRTPKDQAVAAWFAERHGVGPSVASAVGQELGGRVNAAFKTDAAGDLNVVPKSEGASRKISDVFENISDYVLSAEQQAVYDSAMKPILDRHKALSKQYDLLETEVGPEYFPRIVTERPQENVGSLGGGKRVGTKQSFQKERAFDSEAEGWAKGYKYETDVEKRLVTGVEKLYRAMSDKRLANDPVLEGKTRQGLEAELREAYAEEIGSGSMTDAKVTRIADGLQATGTVWQPGFFGKIFDAETANMLNKEFGREQSSVRRTIANANDFIKALALGFDMGVGQIQLLPTLYRNPSIWGKANAKAVGVMFDPGVWQAYADANQPHIRELAQYGSSVGRLPEMVSGMTGGTIKKVPVLREVAKPFARQFQTALDVAKVELWKAWKAVTPPEQHSQVIQTLESQLTTARMESAMVPQGRALMERVLLLAPSYYRGAVNLVAAMGESGVSGHVARQAMGSFIFGSMALFAGIGLAIGMTWEEITKRLNPTRGDFMLWPAEVGGKKFNVGPGSIFRSFLRLAGNTAKTSIETPGNWKSLAPEKNPMTRWYRGHAGPTVGLAWDQFSGRDFLGNRATMEDIPGRVAPLWGQQAVASRGTPAVAATTAAAEFVGLTTIPPVREGDPHYFVVKEKISSRVGFEEYLNTVARKARTLTEDKQMDYVLERLQKDEVSPKYLKEALGKIKLKVLRE